MQDLWGNPIPAPAPQRKEHQATHTPVVTSPQDCLFFGHTPMQWDLSGQTRCSVCHVNISCPECVPVLSPDAVPLFCFLHAHMRAR
jgi:hypothetical protein